MRNKGIGCNCHVVISCAISDHVAVTIQCRDLTDGATNVENMMTFTEKAENLFPKDYGDDFMRAWKLVEGWLFCMGVNDACHGCVIDTILKCSEMSFPPPFSPRLEVHVEVTDIFSYVPKQPRLRIREDDEEEVARVHVHKKFCTQELQV